MPPTAATRPPVSREALGGVAVATSTIGDRSWPRLPAKSVAYLAHLLRPRLTCRTTEGGANLPGRQRPAWHEDTGSCGPSLEKRRVLSCQGIAVPDNAGTSRPALR